MNLADVSALFAQAPAAPEGVPAQWVKAIADDLIAARVQYVTALIKLRVALAPPSTASAADLRGL